MTDTPTTLSAWLARPVLPAPFGAPIRKRDRDGYEPVRAWPTGSLPFALLADHLAAQGLRYARPSGFTRDGARLSPTAVALAVAEVLEEAAEALPWTPAEVEEARASQRFSGAFNAYAALSDALTLTAQDLRNSRGARANTTDLLKEFLPAPEPVEPSADLPAAVAWLAAFDGADQMPRADLGHLYSHQGSPGGLSLADLYALALERWERVYTVRGVRLYRPARHAVGACA